MGLQSNLTLAKLAVEYTSKHIMKLGANNKVSDVITSLGKTWNGVSEMRGVIDKFTGMGSPTKDDPYHTQTLPFYRWRAQVAKKAGMGNCGEQAAVALIFLHEIHRVKPLDYMTYTRPGDHAWVVIGRQKDSKSGDYKTWGSDAVVCDPWGKIAFAAIELPNKLPAYSKYSKHGYHSKLIIR